MLILTIIFMNILKKSSSPSKGYAPGHSNRNLYHFTQLFIVHGKNKIKSEIIKNKQTKNKI